MARTACCCVMVAIMCAVLVASAVADGSALGALSARPWGASARLQVSQGRPWLSGRGAAIALRGGGDAVDVTGDGGVLKEVLVEGTGDDLPQKNDDVCVHYVGTLQSDGSQFDSSRDRGTPFTFKLGQGKVIKGWDEGVATMKRGEKALLTIRADYGYGVDGSGDKIPGNATLLFDVELQAC